MERFFAGRRFEILWGQKVNQSSEKRIKKDIDVLWLIYKEARGFKLAEGCQSPNLAMHTKAASLISAAICWQDLRQNGRRLRMTVSKDTGHTSCRCLAASTVL